MGDDDKDDNEDSKRKHKPISPPSPVRGDKQKTNSRGSSKRARLPSPGPPAPVTSRKGRDSVFQRLGSQRSQRVAPNRAPLRRRQEVRQQQPLEKRTNFCRNFEETGSCRYGNVCIFVHRTKAAKLGQKRNKSRQDTSVRRIVQELPEKTTDSPPRKRSRIDEQPDAAIISRTAEFDEHMKLVEKRKKLKDKIHKLDKQSPDDEKPLDEKIRAIETEVRMGLVQQNARPESSSSGSTQSSSTSSSTSTERSSPDHNTLKNKAKPDMPSTSSKPVKDIKEEKSDKKRSSSRDTRDVKKEKERIALPSAVVKPEPTPKADRKAAGGNEKDRAYRDRSNDQVRYPARELQRRRREEARRSGEASSSRPPPLDDKLAKISDSAVCIKRTIENDEQRRDRREKDKRDTSLDRCRSTNRSVLDTKGDRDRSDRKAREPVKTEQRSPVMDTKKDGSKNDTDKYRSASSDRRARSKDNEIRPSSRIRRPQVEDKRKDDTRADKPRDIIHSGRSKERYEASGRKEGKRRASVSPGPERKQRSRSSGKRDSERGRSSSAGRSKKPREGGSGLVRQPKAEPVSSDEKELPRKRRKEEASEVKQTPVAVVLEEISDDEESKQASNSVASGGVEEAEEKGADWASLLSDQQPHKQPVSSLKLRFAPHRFLRTVPFSPNLLGPELTNKIEDVCNSCPPDDKIEEPFKFQSSTAVDHATLAAKIRARKGLWNMQSCALSAKTDLNIRRSMYGFTPQVICYGCDDDASTFTNIASVSVPIVSKQTSKVEEIHSP